MTEADRLAARLRQAIQGCSVHIHGPVQAWAAVEEAGAEGLVRIEEVATLALEACRKRIEELRAEGVEPEDLRIKKEELTSSFIERLFHNGK